MHHRKPAITRPIFRPARLLLAAVVLGAFAAPLSVARAQLGYDPFAGNLAHSEEKWAPYASADTNGINRPNTVLVNGVDASPANAASFNFGVTAPNPSGAFLTGGGNIYSPTNALTLTLSSTYAPAVGTQNTVVFSIKTLGNPLNASGVLLTLGTGQTVLPRFTSVVNSGAGMGATAQSAFQWDLSSFGGSNNFTITVPGSASSVSFSSAQLDGTTTVYGAQSVVPEPSSVAILLTALGGLTVAAIRSRRRE